VSYILLFPFFFSLPLFFILHVFYLFKNSIIMFTIAAFTALLSLASIAYAQEGAAAPSSVAALVAQLRTAPTEVDRFRLLSDDQFLFDFVNPGTTVGVTTGAGGRTVAATSENFPAIVGNGVSMTIGFLGPCGMNSPHTHPRATEINFSVNTTLRGGVLIENGARFAEIDIAPGSATVFPQGAIHFEMNPSCEEAMFVAGFNGEDPGVNQVAQRYFGLPPDIVGAALGGLGVQQVADLEALIPDNVILGVDECLQRCGITRTGQPTAQRQPRVSANAFPASVTPSNVFALPVQTPSASTTAPVESGTASAPAADSTEAASAGSSEKRGEVFVREHPEFMQFALRR
jgi:oxalate decarboxylase/phosphoglucose isomerase-like protein (cupin superfamily)